MSRSMWLAGFLAACFVAQWIPVAVRPEGPGSVPLESALDVPPHVARTLARACRNCHSADTEWPWYSHVAPVSWLIVHDVNSARKAMDFSAWRKDKPYAAMGQLTAACAAVQSRRMPPAAYRLAHPEARLSRSEVEAFCQWTSAAAGQILQARRKPAPVNP